MASHLSMHSVWKVWKQNRLVQTSPSLMLSMQTEQFDGGPVFTVCGSRWISVEASPGDDCDSN